MIVITFSQRCSKFASLFRQQEIDLEVQCKRQKTFVGMHIEHVAKYRFGSGRLCGVISVVLVSLLWVLRLWRNPRGREKEVLVIAPIGNSDHTIHFTPSISVCMI